MAEEKVLVSSVAYGLIKNQRANNARWQYSCQRRGGIQRGWLESSSNEV